MYCQLSLVFLLGGIDRLFSVIDALPGHLLYCFDTYRFSLGLYGIEMLLFPQIGQGTPTRTE